MPDLEGSEDSIMLINDFKIKWFSLLSRIDSAPTVDEMVLTSLNSMASLLINNRPPLPGYDLLFDVAIKLDVFESIFRWNFIFCGNDLEEYKAKELQFYDSIITGDGRYYLKFSEFTIPLMATLHHCSIRSCVLVERVLVRTLNSVCAALCCHSGEFKFYQNDGPTSECNYDQISVSSRFMFRRLCMGLFDGRSMPLDGELLSDKEYVMDTHSSPTPGSNADKVDWILPSTTNSKPSKHSTSDQGHMIESDGLPLPFRPRIIDSLFDLLAPFVYREGDLGWQARDSLLLLAAYSLSDDEFSRNVAQHSTVCQVLATGLTTLYANLPHRLVKGNQSSNWPTAMIALEECELHSWQFAQFFDALEFCRSVLEICHPVIQASLLNYVHSGFFVSVLGQSLLQQGVEEVTTATIYLERLISLSISSPILPTLLRFLLTPMSPEQDATVATGQTNGTSSTCQEEDKGTTHSPPCEQSAYTRPRVYMDLLISRLHCCNTLLGVATLSLFNTILSLNCEDMMVYLVLRYLVPFRDTLLSVGWKWPDACTYRNASDHFAKLAHANGLLATVSTASSSSSTSVMDTASVSSNISTPTAVGWHGENTMEDSNHNHEVVRSVAELDVDDDTNNLSTFSSASSPKKSSTTTNTDGPTVHHPMDSLMPITPETNGSVVMTGIPAPYSPDLTNSHSHHTGRPQYTSSSGAGTGARKHPRPTTSTDDWMAYTSWAKVAVESRQLACTNWQIVFDQHQPTAHQLASFDILANLDWWHEALGRSSNCYDSQRTIVGHSAAFVNERRLVSNDDVHSIHSNVFCEQSLREEFKREKTNDTMSSFIGTASLDSEEFKLTVCKSFEQWKNSRVGVNYHDEKTNAQLNGFKSPRSVSITKSNVLVSHGRGPVDQLRRPFRKSKSSCDSTDELQRTVEVDSMVPAVRYYCDKNQVKSWYCLSYIDADIGEINGESVDDSVTAAMTSRYVRLQCGRTLDSINTSYSKSKRPLRSISLSDTAVENVVHCSHFNDLDSFVDGLGKLRSPEGTEGKTIDYDDYFDAFLSSSSPTQQENAMLPENYVVGNGSQWSDVDLYHNIPSGKLTTDGSGTDGYNTSLEVNIPNLDDSRHTTAQHLWLINTFLSNGEVPLAGSEAAASIHSAEVFLERLARKSPNDFCELPKVSPKGKTCSSTTQLDCMVDAVVFPDLGPFLNTILSRIESMSNNCFYTNLYLTNLLSHLAAYPVPLLRAILFLIPPSQANESIKDSKADKENATVDGPLDDDRFKTKCLREASSQMPQAALASVRQTLDRFSARFAGSYALGLPTFGDLVLDARRYFRNSAELEGNGSGSGQTRNGLNQARAVSLVEDCRLSAKNDKNSQQRRSMFKRIFSHIWTPHSSKAKASSLDSGEDNISNYQIHSMLQKHLAIQKSWSQFKWLPEVSEPDAPFKTAKRKSFSQAKKEEVPKKARNGTTNSRKNSIDSTSESDNLPINWAVTQRMVLCAVVLEEFCKELSALSMEHSIRC